jgi:hypothetical protein
VPTSADLVLWQNALAEPHDPLANMQAPGLFRQTLRVTPAMEAGISAHVWSIEEIVALLD